MIDSARTLGAATHDAPAAEETLVHTRLQRLALGIEESRAYWRHAALSPRAPGRAVLAFEQRWFGAKSLERVRTLLATLAARYDAFPAALAVLHRWDAMTPAIRPLVCHWHTQLTDPIYRRFTGDFLVERRARPGPQLDIAATLRWVKHTFPGRWGEATCTQFASKLLSAASEATLISPRRDPRALLFPKVPDVAVEYLLYLLRDVGIAGTLVANPYLASVGIEDTRLRGLRSLGFRRMGDVTEFDWAYPDLRAWAEATL